MVDAAEVGSPGGHTAGFAYRPSLDGIRGLAVVAVIAYHLPLGVAPGGFLGVDAFFVLSGFLITSLLLVEHERTGSVDLRDFWSRRARRLLPALWTVVLAVVLVAAVGDAARSVAGDALASILYVANWRFILESRTYFAEAAASSPLQHVWSLAIEEQFYLVWPLVVAAAAAWRPRTRAVALGLATAGSVVVMAVLFTPADPTVAYFHTIARLHELFVGAGVAVALRSDAARRVAGRVVPVLLPVAVGGAVAAVAMLADSNPGYYRGGSLLFAAAVATVVLHLELVEGGRLRRALSWRPLTTVGRRSYGAYLWHWPVVVLLERSWGGSDGAFVLVALVATAVLTEASYRFVERPVRRGTVWGVVLTPRLLARLVPLGTVALVAVIVVGDRATEEPAWMALADADGVVALTSDGGAVAPTPGASARDDDSARPVRVGVVGDSVAASLLVGVEAAAGERGAEVFSVARRGCTVAGGLQVDDDGAPYSYSERCARHVPRALRELVSTADPDVVLWYSGREMNNAVLVDGDVLRPGDARHRQHVAAGLATAADVLTSRGATVVVVEPLPRPGEGSPSCRTACDPGTVPDGVRSLTRELRALAEDHPEVSLESVTRVVCGTGATCDDRHDGVHWRPDGGHFSPEGARVVADELLARALGASAPGSTP